MSLVDCYKSLEGDYEDVVGRLRSERLVQKFVLKFLNDGSYDLLCSSLEAEDYKEAFPYHKGSLPELKLYKTVPFKP